MIKPSLIHNMQNNAVIHKHSGEIFYFLVTGWENMRNFHNNGILFFSLISISDRNWYFSWIYPRSLSHAPEHWAPGTTYNMFARAITPSQPHRFVGQRASTDEYHLLFFSHFVRKHSVWCMVHICVHRNFVLPNLSS